VSHVTGETEAQQPSVTDPDNKLDGIPVTSFDHFGAGESKFSDILMPGVSAVLRLMTNSNLSAATSFGALGDHAVQ
jgi:hypothetical protein